MYKHKDILSHSPSINVREYEYVRRKVEPVNRSQNKVIKLRKKFVNNDDISTGSLEMRSIKLLNKGGNCGSLN